MFLPFTANGEAWKAGWFRVIRLTRNFPIGDDTLRMKRALDRKQVDECSTN
jgi:hypothetical protein